MNPNQPGLIDIGGYQRLSDAELEKAIECAENHREGCACRYGGEVTLPEIVIEDHGAFVVVADRG